MEAKAGVKAPSDPSTFQSQPGKKADWLHWQDLTALVTCWPFSYNLVGKHTQQQEQQQTENSVIC